MLEKQTYSSLRKDLTASQNYDEDEEENEEAGTEENESTIGNMSRFRQGKYNCDKKTGNNDNSITKPSISHPTDLQPQEDTIDFNVSNKTMFGVSNNDEWENIVEDDEEETNGTYKNRIKHGKVEIILPGDSPGSLLFSTKIDDREISGGRNIDDVPFINISTTSSTGVKTSKAYGSISTAIIRNALNSQFIAMNLCLAWCQFFVSFNYR